MDLVQDTLYARQGTQVYAKSYIEVLFYPSQTSLIPNTVFYYQGAVDFIFGREGESCCMLTFNVALLNWSPQAKYTLKGTPSPASPPVV